MWVSTGVELVLFKDCGEGNLQIQLAVNGKLAPMIDDHRSNLEKFSSDGDYFKWMARQSELLIHLYGDARNPLSLDQSQRRQQEGF